MFRRLRNDLFDVKILDVGMTQGGGFKMQKRSVKSASWPAGNFKAQQSIGAGAVQTSKRVYKVVIGL